MSKEQNRTHLSEAGIVVPSVELQDMHDRYQKMRDLGASLVEWPEQRVIGQMKRAFGMYGDAMNKVGFQDLAKSVSSSIQVSSEAAVHAINQLFRQVDDSGVSLIESYSKALSVNEFKFENLLPSFSNLILPSVTSHLPDFGASSVFNQLVMAQSAILDQARHLIESVANLPDFSQLAWRSLPSNLQDCGKEVNLDEIVSFLQQEGIPLYLVPRKCIVVRLLRAQNTAARRQVLSACCDQIVEDCVCILETVAEDWDGDELSFIVDAIGAMRAGFVRSAQAMLTAVLDTLIRRFVPDLKMRRSLTNHRNGANVPDVFDGLNLRQGLVWLPIWNAHKVFWVDKGDRVPRVYSRHASVHGVSRRQFSKRNCLQVLMLVTSLVGYHGCMSSFDRQSI